MERKAPAPRGATAAALRAVRGADAATYAATAAFLARRDGAPICLQLEAKTVFTPVRATGSRLRRHYQTARHLAAVFGAARRDVLSVARAVALLAARARVSLSEILRARPATGRRLVSLVYELARAAAAARAPAAEEQTVSIAADTDSIVITEASPDDAPMEDADAPIASVEAVAAAVLPAPPQDHPVVAKIVSAVTSFVAKAADRVGNLVSKVGRLFGRKATEASA